MKGVTDKIIFFSKKVSELSFEFFKVISNNVYHVMYKYTQYTQNNIKIFPFNIRDD